MSTRVHFNGRPVWAEISLGAIAKNFRAIRRHVGRKRKILAIVKANAYGHGAVPVAKALAKAGADWFGVTCVEEGAELRDSGIREPILILSGFWPGEERRLIENRLTPAITQIEQLRYLERAAASLARSRKLRGPYRVHLKVDTGMNRLGVSPAEMSSVAEALADSPHVCLDGAFTHFSSAEDFTSELTEHQHSLFYSAVERLRAERVTPGTLHLANSAGVAARPESWADMVRPGAILYGYHQFFDPPEKKFEAEQKITLQPAFSLRARIISIRDVPAGQGVGYNARFVTERPSRIAVIAAGYADGIVRALTNRGRVLVRGACVPIIGIVSMDLTMVDVTGLPDVRVGDIATIYGSSGPGGPTIWASDVARLLGSVTSDLLCSVGARVPRFYLS
ncbi:MAG TPA: alanine racemase [Candidatus Acidoferrales bacterium]|nr:alanine racemase [Candidatus Acidoferrales bacterium]